MSWIPLVSQLKSGVQLLTGDSKGARETQEQFVRQCPVISQVTSLVQLAKGDRNGALETQKMCAETVGGVLNSTPVVGHVKAGVHLICNDKEGALQAVVAANRTSVIMGTGAVGGLVGGPIGAVAAGVAAGTTHDKVHSIVANEEMGVFATMEEVSKADKKGGAVFDLVSGVIFDGLTGNAGFQVAKAVKEAAAARKATSGEAVKRARRAAARRRNRANRAAKRAGTTTATGAKNPAPPASSGSAPGGTGNAPPPEPRGDATASARAAASKMTPESLVAQLEKLVMEAKKTAAKLPLKEIAALAKMFFAMDAFACPEDDEESSNSWSQEDEEEFGKPNIFFFSGTVDRAADDDDQDGVGDELDEVLIRCVVINHFEVFTANDRTRSREKLAAVSSLATSYEVIITSDTWLESLGCDSADLHGALPDFDIFRDSRGGRGVFVAVKRTLKATRHALENEEFKLFEMVGLTIEKEGMDAKLLVVYGAATGRCTADDVAVTGKEDEAPPSSSSRLVPMDADIWVMHSEPPLVRHVQKRESAFSTHTLKMFSIVPL